MLVKNALIRGLTPFVIMTVITLIMHFQGLDRFQVKSTFIVGLISAFVGAATVIYEIEGWSLLHNPVYISL